MKLLLLGLFLFGLAALLAKLKKGGEPGGEWPYYAKKPLTQPEQVLYHRLVKALPEHIVLAQVQLSRVLGVKQGYDFQQWNNRINRMSLDFMVCDKDFSVIAAIELDDKSHERADRQEADKKKDKALTAAGIPIVRWKTNALPDESAIKQSLAK